MAAMNGHLAVLRWARSMGCPCDKRTRVWAKKNGHRTNRTAPVPRTQNSRVPVHCARYLPASTASTRPTAQP